VVGRGSDRETVRLRDTASGLAQMQAPEGTLISFATQPGSVARDGIDGHSPYSKVLAETIRRPGLGIFDVFNEVGLEVKRATGGGQQPWVSSSPIDGSFYFVPQQTGIAVGALPNAAAASGFSQPQFSASSSTEQAGGLFTQQDMERVRAIAARNQLLVMPPFKIERPPSEIPVALRRFIGVWASDVGFNGGRARHAMLIVTKVEGPAEAAGYWMNGSPTAGEPNQAPAGALRIHGMVTENQLTFPPEGGRGGSLTATLNRAGDFSVFASGSKAYITLEPVWQLLNAENSAVALPKSPAEASASLEPRAVDKSPKHARELSFKYGDYKNPGNLRPGQTVKIGTPDGTITCTAGTGRQYTGKGGPPGKGGGREIDRNCQFD
jgi:hypothetical protein